MNLAEFLQNKYKKARIKNERLSFLKKILITLFIVLFLFNVVFGVTRVTDNSNSPNLRDGDIVFYYRLHKEYACSDVIYYEHNGKDYFGRIRATAGTEIDAANDGKLMINDNIQIAEKEKNIFYNATVTNTNKYPYTIGTGEYFVLSDFRGRSFDSRQFGPLKKDDIKGKVFFVIRKNNI